MALRVSVCNHMLIIIHLVFRPTQDIVLNVIVRFTVLVGTADDVVIIARLPAEIYIVLFSPPAYGGFECPHNNCQPARFLKLVRRVFFFGFCYL